MPTIVKIFILGTILAGFSNFLFGSIIYLKNRKEKQNIIFLLLELSIVLWLFSYAIWLAKDNAADALFWSRMLNLGATLIPVFFLHWIVTFLGLSRKKILIFAYISTIIFSLFSFSPFYVQKVKEVSIFPYWPQAGWLYSIFLASFVICFGYGFMFLYRFIKEKSNDKEKILQVKYIFLGSIISATGGIFNFPLMYGIPFIPLTLTTIFHPIFWAYGILKHNLFNVKAVITEFLVIFLLVILFLNIFFYISILELAFKIFIFIASSFLGVFIIRSVLKEVRMREEMERLAGSLEKANEQLKKIDEAKSDFIHIASHQLRTPLTAIKGFGSMMLEGSYGQLSDIFKKPLDRIMASTDRMVKLVGDLLNVSRIEQGKIEYKFANFDIREMIKGLVEEFQVAIKKENKKKIDVGFEDSAAGRIFIRGDQDKLNEVVSNLIDNAIKYTPDGFIKIGLKFLQGQKVLIRVRDSGIGMNKETLGKIFEKFSRADNASK